MEAALKDFQEWMASLSVSEIQYYAVFDNSGTVTGIYTSHSAENIDNKIAIDKEVAESVFEGKTTLASYVVDLTSANLEFIEIQSLSKIDDVLHRVVNKQWSAEIDNDVFLTYNRKDKCIIIELSSKYNGTKLVENIQPKKVHWSGTTELSFLLSHYNDPSWLVDIVSVKLDELIKNKKIISDIELPANFSVYTRRLFKNYVVEEI
jgi:predicted transcriptional regulator